MIKWILNKIKYHPFLYNTLNKVNEGKLRITKKGKVKKNEKI